MQQICSFFSGKHNLQFNNEYYSINIKLDLPNVDINYNRGIFNKYFKNKIF